MSSIEDDGGGHLAYLHRLRVDCGIKGRLGSEGAISEFKLVRDGQDKV